MPGWNIDIFTKVTRLQRETKQAKRVTCGSSGSTVAVPICILLRVMVKFADAPMAMLLSTGPGEQAQVHDL